MFFDIGWPELMLIGVVALVVIGPKDLPRALRIAGYWVRKARNMSREVQNSIDQMIREAELEDLRNDLKTATEFDFEHEFHRTVDPDGTLTGSIKPPEVPDYFVEKPEVLPPVEGAAAAALPAAAAAPELLKALPAEAGAEPATHELETIAPAAETDIPAPQPLPAKS